MITSTTFKVNYITNGTSCRSYQHSSKSSLKNKLPAFIRRRIARRKIAKAIFSNDVIAENISTSNAVLFTNSKHPPVDSRSFNRIINVFHIVGNIVGTVSIILMFALPFFAGIL